MGLTFACPYDQGNPSECPLCEVRGLPVRRRVTWVKMLTDDDLAFLETYHQICLQCRESFVTPV